MAIKVVIGTKEGKSLQKELQDAESESLLGKKIGDKISGDAVGFAGYEFEITGGSDYCGFPMRKDIDGHMRKKILDVQCVGLKKKANGIRQRKTVCGNTIHPKTAQVNLRILKAGNESLFPPEKAAETTEQPAAS